MSTGTLRFLHRLIRNLVIPSNAGPNDPAYIVGPDIRQIVADYYANASIPPGQVIFSEYMQLNEDVYEYRALVIEEPQTVFVATGVVAFNLSDVQYISEASRIIAGNSLGGFASTVFGAIATDPGGLASGRVTIAAGSLLSILSDAVLEGTLQVNIGGDITYDSDSLVTPTAFTPTWTAGGTPLTINGGQSEGRYIRRGDWLDVWMLLLVDTTTVFPAGSLAVSNFPFSFTTIDTGIRQTVPGLAVDNNNNANNRTIYGRITATTFDIYQLDGTRVTNAAPFAVGDNDSYVLQGSLWLGT